MVTKHVPDVAISYPCSVLAKIHMVTKLLTGYIVQDVGSVLAKIHMVTKQRIS